MRRRAASSRAASSRGGRGGGRPRRISFRAAALLVLLGALLVSALYPARQLLSQRDQVAALRSEEVLLTERIEALERDMALLETDAEVERIARETLGMVRPDEVAFAIVDPLPPRGAGDDDAASEALEPVPRPWYLRMWAAALDTVRAALR